MRAVRGCGEKFADEARLVVERGDRRRRWSGRGSASRFRRPRSSCADARARPRRSAAKAYSTALSYRQTFLIRQQVHGDEVHVLGELRIAQPDVPGLGGGHRLARSPCRTRSR